MSLEFLSREATDKLVRDVGKNLDAYRSGNTAALIAATDCHISKIEGAPPPFLDDLAEDKQDALATQRVFQWLSQLTPVQAADERLWVLLTHRYFASYVHKRWGGRLQDADKPEELVLRRWFFRGSGLATFVQNALSRLWWFGHLTYDNRRENPFELTDVLLSLQDIQTGFLERSLGRCRPLLRAVLEAILKHEDEFRNAPDRGTVVQQWAKEINLYGGAYLLDALPPDRLSFVVQSKLRARLKTVSV
jgi:Family of unknown function (DUF6339)